MAIQFESSDARLDPALNEIRDRGHNKSLARFAVPIAGAVVIGICLFGHLGAIGLLGPDEPRYAWIARAMAETGDWVTPRLYGQPWFEKPILYYWAAGLGFALHLPAEWAARLPSAFAALAAALGIGWLGWKHYDDRDLARSPALLAPLLFATSVAAIGFARAASPDMLFSASITLALASAACVFRHNNALRGAAPPDLSPSRGDKSPLFLFGAFLGLAVLAKGPAAIVLVGGAIGLWALTTKQWRAAVQVMHPLAVLTFCVVALPWYIVCTRRNPDFLRVFLLQHNFERYLTPVFQHRQPFWYFGPIVLLALLPWTALLWPTAEEALRIRAQPSWRNSPGLFFACWGVFPLIFFSLSQSKLPGYALPAIPPLALLCSVAAGRAIKEEGLKSRVVFGVIGCMWILLGVAALYLIRRTPLLTLEGLVSPIGVAAAAGAAIAGVAVVVLALYGKRHAVIVLSIFLVASSVEAANVGLLPKLDALYSARSHAQFMRNDQHPERIFTYHLSRGWNFGLAFYFRREIPEWSPHDPQSALVLTTPGGIEEIRKLGRFRGPLDENYVGILYVPIGPVPVSR
jgi:4-amino-4-deoxy-L-arabinose transferase-like glycosyltransferase